MAENKTKKVLITDTILRDAHQSQAATSLWIVPWLHPGQKCITASVSSRGFA